MGAEKRTIRVSAAAILCALAVRLLCGSIPGELVRFFGSPEVATAILYLETGRILRTPVIPEETQDATQFTTAPPTETTEPTQATQAAETPALPAFGSQEAAAVRLCGNCKYTPDMEALMSQPLSWDLTADGPAVLIVHSHATESYVNHGEYVQTSQYRTLDESFNMISVGDRIAQLLEAGGVQVLHDRSAHDYPDFTAAYGNSRSSVENYLAQYPSVRLVLDIHRDAVEDGSGAQMSFLANDGETAGMMLVVGTDAGGSYHPNWSSNMALALKLHAQLNRLCPGVSRPISFRTQRFNQDLGNANLLVEMGAAGNTHDQAIRAADTLANAILALAHGANH